jgi:homoserine O-succinyltransferase
LGIDDLWDRHLDGLIVTGMEPRAPNLSDEPYWPHLARLIDWAGRNTHSTVWSCLAAHAAVLHMDSIERRRLPEKRVGLFDCHRVAEHPLTSGIPERFAIPHSRWNDLPEEQLAACGYSVLTRGGDAGADSFVKPGKSLFVFFQGHPEYEGHTLLLEYLRDVGNYLAREAGAYPAIPRGYFDRVTEDKLQAIQEQALRDRGPELLTDVRAALNATNLANSWHSPATCIYSNWLNYLRARKHPPEMQPSDAAAEPTSRVPLHG